MGAVITEIQCRSVWTYGCSQKDENTFRIMCVEVLFLALPGRRLHPGGRASETCFRCFAGLLFDNQQVGNGGAFCPVRQRVRINARGAGKRAKVGKIGVNYIRYFTASGSTASGVFRVLSSTASSSGASRIATLLGNSGQFFGSFFFYFRASTVEAV